MLSKLLENKYIIISSTQYPDYGGAATNAYALIKYLRQYCNNVIGLFFNNDLNVNKDPDNIGNIILSKNNKRLYPLIIKQIVQMFNGNKPDIILAKNYVAPLLCKEMFPMSKVIYLVSGINHFWKFYNNLTAQDVLKKSFEITDIFHEEIKCIEASDVSVLNSKLALDIFQKIYGKQYSKKIYKNFVDTTKINKSSNFKNTNITLEDKKYDILICCSNLLRSDKNNNFLIDVLTNPEFDKYKKIIIGNNSKKFNVIKNSTQYGLLSNTEVLKYMRKSKILLFPSLFDANSNTVREALNSKCLPVITKNIGYHECFPEYLICNSFEKKEWNDKVKYVLENYPVLYNNKIKINTEESLDKFLVNIL